MSVLACDRIGCDSVMCDFYSPKYGHLCYSCANEYNNYEEDIDLNTFINHRPKIESLNCSHFKEDVYEVFSRL